MDKLNDDKLPLGYLFENIAFKSPDDVENFINNLNQVQSFFVVKSAIEMAHSKNIFSLVESEILSKSLRILNSEYLKNNDGNRQE